MAQGIDPSVKRGLLPAWSTNEQPQTSCLAWRSRHATVTNMTPRSVLMTQHPFAGPSRAANVHEGVAANDRVAVGREGPPSHWADLLGPLVHRIAKLLGNEVDVASMRATTRYPYFLSTLRTILQ